MAVERFELGEKLLKPIEVAEIFQVDPRTVTRWAREGRLSTIRTPGGHRRYLEREVKAMIAVTMVTRDDTAAVS